MRRDPPCRTCNDRYPACHAECDKYKAWRDEHNAHKAAEYSYKRMHGEVTAVEFDARMRFCRRDSLKRKAGQR